LKANFKIAKNEDLEKAAEVKSDNNKEVSEKEFEDFVVKAGAAGSFMVFRSTKKDEELGIDEL